MPLVRRPARALQQISVVRPDFSALLVWWLVNLSRIKTINGCLPVRGAGLANEPPRLMRLEYSSSVAVTAIELLVGLTSYSLSRHSWILFASVKGATLRDGTCTMRPFSNFTLSLSHSLSVSRSSA